MEPANEYRIALVTIDSEENAKSLSKALIESKLAACINLIPDLTSIFRWEGAVEETHEILMIIKTKVGLLESLEEKVVELHPYDCPEFLVLEIDRGAGAYLKWIDDSLELRD